ncbi:hypothetical protein D9757_005866 [Collybiopsis confluens]|uniref:F-box domain-containing protein n=1 Tax=Collybiopsis confluens TaxID=2823264 RepID=A0A8H5HMZ0_9AGAR|nr:hypothetical protein D9757_005866 [Collybiopsis confluens]
MQTSIPSQLGYPQELIDGIIEFLHDEKTALLNCSLITECTTRNRKVVQKVVQNGNTFLNLLSSSGNTIVPYITTLSLNVQEPWLIEILRAISGAPLAELSVRSHTRPWNTPSSLTEVCESFPNLVDLSLAPIFTLDDEILQFLSRFKGLRSLSLTPSFRADRADEFPTDISLSGLNQLETLRLSLKSAAMLEWFQISGWTPRLTTLDIILYRHHHKGWGPVSQLNSLLEKNQNTLEHLRIKVMYYNERHDWEDSPDGPDFGHMDLSCLTHLRSFSARVHDIEASRGPSKAVIRMWSLVRGKWSGDE